MNLSRLSLAFVTALTLAGCAEASDGDDTGPSGEPAQAEAAQSVNGRIGSHGMVLFGDRTRAYVSHIPMFGAPHDVQVIAEIALPSPPTSLPLSFSDRLYTFLPDRMSLDAFRLGTLRTMKGTIYLGNFETPTARPVARNVSVDIVRIVHQHELRANEATPTKGTYFLFGTAAKTFAVHRIAGAPSFDQIVAVDLGARRPSGADLANGVVATLAGADDVEARLEGPATFVGPTGQSVDVTHALELSCLLGDGFTDACE